MSIAKVSRYARQHGIGPLAVKLCREAPTYLRHLGSWRLRACECCGRTSLFINKAAGEEFTVCSLCGANLRYELLAAEIRERFAEGLSQLRIVELDPASPLRTLFAGHPHYTRTFYSPDVSPGQVRDDGAQCEDITNPTFADGSVDLMISSDVLEHVPDLEKALRAISRVLSPAGVHLFTVPYRDHTRPRAVLRDGKVVHLLEPEYHCDPLNPRGILAFWDVGRDLPEHFDVPELTLRIIRGPVGRDRRVVWSAARSA